MANPLLVDRVDDADLIDHVFLLSILRQRLTDREHAILALRFSGYTRSTIVTLLGIGKTTVYTAEKNALEKLHQAFEQEERSEWTDTNVSAAGGPSHGSLPSAQPVSKSMAEPAENGPTG